MNGELPAHEVSAAPDAPPGSTPIAHALAVPVPPTPFVGRERQVADICALLGRQAVRLVTLTGPGGIGKTRLALSVSDALHGEFPEGVHSVSLAHLRDAALVLPAIGRALRMDEGREVSALAPQPAMLERLQNLIDDRKILLVLDNLEQVIGSSGDLAALLNGCPRLKMLVTSRELLRVSAEHNYPVPPLALPDVQHLPPFPFLAQVEAVRLFVTRAQAVDPGFELTSANAESVAAICHQLDGLPLAIELAAARTRLLPPAVMLAHLGRSLSWLTGGARDAPARHQTLRAALNWSYDLLEADEQRMFRQLAVFAGGCTLEAIAAVCSFAPELASSEEDLFGLLASLLDKSLVRQEPGGAEGVRFSMLETVRQYALERLEAGGEEEVIRRAHALYYTSLAEEAEAGLQGPDQEVWLTRLEQEHDNLRAALAWAVGQGDPELGARISAALWRFWLLRGHLSEGQRWLDATLAGAPALPPALRARALNGAGRLALRQGDYASAQRILEESLALWRDIGDRRGEMQAQNSLGLVAIYQGNLPQAQSYFEQNLAGWRALGEKQGIVRDLNNLGLVLRYREEFDRAAELYEECLELAKDLPDKYPTAAALHNLGQMAHHRGDDVTAHRLLTESVKLVRRIGDTPSLSVCLADLAGVWATQGHPERAARLFGAAEALRDKIRATMYSFQRMAYERDVESGMSQLDKATWDAAWAEGRTLSIDDACALALDELPVAPAEPAEITAPALPENVYDLTEREREVLRLLVAGLTYAEIAERLTLSFHTVHAHLRSIYSKLGVTSRIEAARFASAHGLA